MVIQFDETKLISRRQAAFWTQEDLAAASGVSVHTIQRMENGRSASLESWKAVAGAFDVSLEEFQSVALVISDAANMFQMTPRQAAINATIGCAGGLLGCGFGWWAIFRSVPDFQGAVTDIWPLTLLVTFATAICFIVPIVQWKRLIR